MGFGGANNLAKRTLAISRKNKNFQTMFWLKSDPITVTNYPSTDKLQENSSHKVDRKKQCQVKFIGNETKEKPSNFLKISMKIISRSIKS